MLDSFSSLVLSHFNGRADVLHQKGMIKCLGSVAEAVSGNDSLHLFFEKGRLTNKQSRCKASSGGKVSREILLARVFRHTVRCGRNAWEWFSSRPHSAPRRTAQTLLESSGRRRSVSEMTAANTAYEQEIQPPNLLHFAKAQCLRGGVEGKMEQKGTTIFIH